MPESSSTPKIYIPELGEFNEDLEGSRKRLLEGHAYRDLSTILVVPTRGLIHARVVQSWISLMPNMNQKLVRIPPMVLGSGMEVGHAYNNMVEQIMAHPILRTFKFLLTLEEDNMPPADGLQRLHKAMCDGPWAAVGGLYWTKGEGGQPMIYGDPEESVLGFQPQVPKKDTVQECRGLGMGFTMFDLSLFMDEELRKPWFRTVMDCGPGGASTMTQDLYFFQDLARHGYRVACDTSCKVGHFSVDEDKVW